MINYNKYRVVIEQMYEDTVTISRYADVKDPVTRETKHDSQPIYVNQSCKLSQTSLPRNGQTEDANNIQYNAKLFIAPELEIKQGDLIAVTRKATGRVEKYVAGKPFPPYSSHQEIDLTAKEWA
jgi:ribonucleotide monophosphatase NagD (HAD superfamily)